MEALPYIQLYVADYLADTAHLNRAQSGSYMYLLMNYWQTGKPLDNKGERLATVARMTNEEWEVEKPILAEFFTIKRNKWIHSRMEYDLERVLSKSKKRAFAGSESARSRANKRLTSVEQVLTEVEGDVEVEVKTKKISVNKVDPTEDPDFKVFWAAYPKKVKLPLAAKSYQKALTKTTPDEIFQGLIRYQRVCGENPRYIANPDGWLNQGRWMDITNPESLPKVEGTPSQSSNHFEAPAVGQYGVKVCSVCETQWPCAEMQKRGVK